MGTKNKDHSSEKIRELQLLLERKESSLLELKREIEIEAALERFRARAMAMRHPDELSEVLSVVFGQFDVLGICPMHCTLTIFDEEANTAVFRMTGREGKRFFAEQTIDLDAMDEWNETVEQWKKKEPNSIHSPYYPVDLLPKVWQVFDEILSQLPEDARIYPEDFPDGMYFCEGNYRYGYIGFCHTRRPTEEEKEIVIKVATEFERTYTRFLDLKKAEAQAREAQIEAALERVRARAMAMHRSDELAETSTVLFEQMKALGIEARRVGFALMKDEGRMMEIYSTVRLEDGTAQLLSGKIYEDQHPQLTNFVASWRRNDPTMYSELHGAELKSYYRAIQKTLNFSTHMKSEIEKAPSEYYHLYNFGLGLIYAFSSTPFNDEENHILKRFTQAFDLVYRRFQDLQKAEAQTRQAQIETAMEKVRSRAMAMQKPDELLEVAQLLRREMGLLGVEALETSSIYIHHEETGKTECWYAIQDQEEKKLVNDHMIMNLNDTWVGREMLKFYRSDQKQISLLMKGEPRKEWIHYCAAQSNEFSTHGFYGDNIPDRTYHLHKFSNGYIGAASPGEISEESWDLLKRATAVFSLAYTRFNDLQQAEASAKEAVKQASLDRIRADTASMRSISDLDRITPLIWNELTVLGIPFIRCGVFIIDEDQQWVEAHLSAPDGHSLGILKLAFDANEVTRETVEHWQRKEVYLLHWDKKEFVDWTKSMLDKGQIQNVQTYQGAESPPDSLHLHFVPFVQGMMYVGNSELLNEEQIELVRAMAEAFSTAYARYEDFIQLEKAKHDIETTLTELKAAQAQLIQTEKMASLGELTAGIAHEIQNPLNFVNNFSEVSNELIEEMKEELTKGSTEDAIAIVDDVRQNLEKILLHGKRADGIVKSMLQHSRATASKKEPTDINALADEYLRLAYHGLRAKDKTFNAKFSTKLDPDIPKISVIPQDIGRVVLNLINNAFYAVTERKKLNESGFEPAVNVLTKSKGDTIEIIVKDNGMGISKKNIDKIFQPFFTTKPTGQGTGLGLSLAYDIVTKGHGGELKVETKEGVGSEFTIVLPVKD